MKVAQTAMPGVLVLDCPRHGQARSSVCESFNQREVDALVGLGTRFVQDNHSRSLHGVLRGLHYQVRRPQGKLVRVLHGSIFDVVVDLRDSSPTFGQWLGMELAGDAPRQLWIPPGFAHGFQVLSESADVVYKTTDYYEPDDEACIAWDDPTIGVQWPLKGTPILSAKDTRGAVFQPGLQDASYKQ